MMSFPSPPSSCDLNAPNHIDHLNVAICADEVKFVREPPLWGNGSEIAVSFLDGSLPQKALVEDVFKEYGAVANLDFNFLQTVDNEAHIRVTFDGDKTWSSVGRNALKIPSGPTMAFGRDGGVELDGTIVRHHVGHALGLEHYWYAKLPDGVDDTSIMNHFIGSPHTLPAEGATLSESDKAWLLINYPAKSAGNLENAVKTLRIPFESAFRADPRRGYADFTSAKSQEALRGILIAALKPLKPDPADSSKPKVAYHIDGQADQALDSDEENDDLDAAQQKTFSEAPKPLKPNTVQGLESDEDNDDLDTQQPVNWFDKHLNELKSEDDFIAFLSETTDTEKRKKIKARMKQVIDQKYLLWAVMLHPKFRQGIANIVEGRLRSKDYKMIIPLAVQQNIWESIWRVATNTLGLLSQNSISPTHVALAAANPPADPEVQRNILTTILDLLFDVAPDGYYYPQVEGQAPLPQHSFWNSDWFKKIADIGIKVGKNTMKELIK